MQQFQSQINKNTISTTVASFRKRTYKKRQFILDCVNQQKSNLKQYKYLKDKYLNFFVVRIPKKLRLEDQKSYKKTLNSKQLKSFIQKERRKALGEVEITKKVQVNNKDCLQNEKPQLIKDKEKSSQFDKQNREKQFLNEGYKIKGKRFEQQNARKNAEQGKTDKVDQGVKRQTPESILLTIS